MSSHSSFVCSSLKSYIFSFSHPHSITCSVVSSFLSHKGHITLSVSFLYFICTSRICSLISIMSLASFPLQFKYTLSFSTCPILFSLSNSLFHVGKKMPTQKLCNEFHVSKNGIHISNFQKNLNFLG